MTSALPCILPRPAALTAGDGFFALTQDTAITCDAATQPVAALLAVSLAPALGSSLPVRVDAPANARPLDVRLEPGLAHLGREGYQLVVTPHAVALRSAGVAGAYYATQTLRQLLPAEVFSTLPMAREWPIPAVTIEDSPRFAWRGFLLDTARHFFPKHAILKLIDTLSLHKLNVLHVHLTDDQGWRVEIRRYPKLTEVGAWRKETVVGHARRPEGYDGTPHGGFYSQADLREIVGYAAARQITVVPEIEMPGHAQAAIAAYRELGVTGQPVEVATTWGVFPNLFTPDDATLGFLEEVLAEVLEIFPSPYIHIGGDEAVKDQWQASPQVQARIHTLALKDEEDLQRWFLSRIGAFLTRSGRRLVGWDEMLEGGLPPGAVVMSWRGVEGGILAAQHDCDAVMVPTGEVYFDKYQSNDPGEPLAIGGYIPLERAYAYEPVPAGLTDEQARHILGAECALWTEYIATVDHLEYMAFPRAIALAEATWSPRSLRDFADFRRRLAAHEPRLTRLGINFWPLARLEREAGFPLRRDP